jgi:SdrD B-like domain
MEGFMSKAHPRLRPGARPEVESLEERAVPAVISGTVYQDLNSNGLLNPGESGIAGNTIQLQNSAGTVIATTTTDANGNYTFNADQTVNTSPLTKEVDAVFSQAHTDTNQTASIAQFDPSLGTLTSIDIIAQATITTDPRVENLNPDGANITATVNGNINITAPGVGGANGSLTAAPSTTLQADLPAFDGTADLSGTSAKDFGPQQLAGQFNTVTLSNPSDLAAYIGTGSVNVSEQATATSSVSGPGNLLAMIQSTAQGSLKVVYHYTPSNALHPGQYTIVQPTPPAGYVPSGTTSGNVTAIPPTTPPETIAVTLGSTDSTNNNFGEIQASNLSGVTYNDVNDNGIPDAGDGGFGGINIQLTGTNNLGQSVSETTTSNAIGLYSFSNLRPGTYTLTKMNEASGFFNGAANPGSTGGVASLPTVISQIQLGQGVTSISNNFGSVAASGVSGTVYSDNDHSRVLDASSTGLAGVTVQLTGTNDLGQQVMLTTQTNAQGIYGFGTLRPGSYTITDTPPSGYTPDAYNVGTINGVTTGSVSGASLVVTLPTGVTGVNYNFGETAPSQGSSPPVSPNQPGDTTSPPSSPTNGIPSKIAFVGSDVSGWGW